MVHERNIRPIVDVASAQNQGNVEIRQNEQ
jgi:hypothetical protein